VSTIPEYDCPDTTYRKRSCIAVIASSLLKKNILQLNTTINTFLVNSNYAIYRVASNVRKQKCPAKSKAFCF